MFSSSRNRPYLHLSFCFWSALAFLFPLAKAQAAVTIPLTINMSEAVTVTGTPRIAVTVGSVTRYAAFSGGSGTSALTFTLTPQAGDVDLDGVAVSSPIDLNGGTMRDSAGNNAVLTFTPPNTSGIKVNYPSLGMDFVYDADGRYTLNGTAYNDLPSFLTAAGGTFSRASIGTYFDSTGTLQIASSGVPRFDWDPATHTAKGILIEESRTNLLPYSQSDTGWVSGGTTPPTVMNSQTYLGLPCMSATFTSAQTSTGYAGSRATRQGAGVTYAPVVTATQYTTSFFVTLSRALTGAETVGLYFTGSNGLGIFYLTAANSGAYVGKWARITTAAVTTVTSGNDYPTIFLNTVMTSPITIYTNNWQIEQGAFGTSYIPTSATAVTRAADVLSLPVGAWFDGTKGTVMATHFMGGTSNARVISIDTNAAPIIRNASGSQLRNWSGSSGPIVTPSVFPSLSASAKTAASWSDPDGALASIVMNGESPISGSYTAGQYAGSVMYIGSRASAGFLNAAISQVKVYPVRLSDTQLQQLTQ